MSLRSTSEFVRGTISSAEFDAGHRLVIGCWEESPLGRMVDVMWGQPNGSRVLLAPNRQVADYIASIYEFDDILVGPLSITSDGGETTMDGFGWSVRLLGGWKRPVPFPRPATFTETIEAPIAKALMGVTVSGTSPSGVRETYQTSGWRWIKSGSASWHDESMGEPRPLTAPMNVGFSEPPRKPSIVSVRVSIARPEDRR